MRPARLLTGAALGLAVAAAGAFTSVPALAAEDPGVAVETVDISSFPGSC